MHSIVPKICENVIRVNPLLQIQLSLWNLKILRSTWLEIHMDERVTFHKNHSSQIWEPLQQQIRPQITNQKTNTSRHLASRCPRRTDVEQADVYDLVIARGRHRREPCIFVFSVAISATPAGATRAPSSSLQIAKRWNHRERVSNLIIEKEIGWSHWERASNPRKPKIDEFIDRDLNEEWEGDRYRDRVVGGRDRNT